MPRSGASERCVRASAKNLVSRLSFRLVSLQSAAVRPRLSRMVRLVLFDIDGTLVRTSGAGVKAFAKVFATEFGAVDGFERLKFSGRTDVSLVREFFGLHDIPATAENFRRFFERYVFWLDDALKQSQGAVCPGVWKFL